MSPTVQSPSSLPSLLPSDNFFQALAHAYTTRVTGAAPGNRQIVRYASANIPAAPGSTSAADYLPMASSSGITGSLDAASAPGSSASVRALIVAAARQESVPVKLLSSIVRVESGYQPGAVSPVGA